MQVSAKLAEVWTCAPQVRGFMSVVSSWEGIGLAGASGLGQNAYIVQSVRHKYGRPRNPSLRQEIAAAIIQIEPDIFADINLVHLTKRVRERGLHRADRTTVRRALQDLRAANRDPRDVTPP